MAVRQEASVWTVMYVHNNVQGCTVHTMSGAEIFYDELDARRTADALRRAGWSMVYVNHSNVWAQGTVPTVKSVEEVARRGFK